MQPFERSSHDLGADFSDNMERRPGVVVEIDDDESDADCHRLDGGEEGNSLKRK